MDMHSGREALQLDSPRQAPAASGRHLLCEPNKQMKNGQNKGSGYATVNIRSCALRDERSSASGAICSGVRCAHRLQQYPYTNMSSCACIDKGMHCSCSLSTPKPSFICVNMHACTRTYVDVHTPECTVLMLSLI